MAERGPAPEVLEPLFAALDADPLDTLDGAHDTDNMPLALEPDRVRDDLSAMGHSVETN